MGNRKVTLDAWHREHGAKMVPFGGWEMPIQYSGIVAEHMATRKFGGLFDVSHMGRLAIHGKDKVAFLQKLLTNDAQALEPLRAQYTIIQNGTGGAVDDAYLYRLGDDEFMLVVNAANTRKDLDWFARHNDFDVQIEDITDQVGMLALQGPASERILEDIVEGALPGAGRNTVSKVNVCGAAVTVSRTGYTGEPVCFELFVPAESVVAVWERILERGAGEGVVPVGLGARDTLRLEAGMPLYGHEFGTDKEGNEIPVFAVPLAKFAVSFAERKGDFLGRDILERQAEELKQAEGDSPMPESERLVPRRARGVCLLDRGVVREGSEVERDGKLVGYVTSATTVPYWQFEGKGEEASITDKRGNRCIGLALIDTAVAPRDEVNIVYRERRLSAKVVRNHMSVKYPPYARALLPKELREA